MIGIGEDWTRTLPSSPCSMPACMSEPEPQGTEGEDSSPWPSEGLKCWPGPPALCTQMAPWGRQWGCVSLTGCTGAREAWVAPCLCSRDRIPGLRQVATVCLGHVTAKGEVGRGQGDWATGVTRSLDGKVSSYPQEPSFKIALSPDILVALGPSVLWLKIIWQLSFLQSENGFWGCKTISELSQLAQPGED